MFSPKRTIAILKVCGVLAILAMLAACSGTGGATSTSSVTPTIQSGTVLASTPGAGPTVIAITTAVATQADIPTSTTQGNTSKQVIPFADRTLTIGQVSKKVGTGASTAAISLTITVTNTSASPVMNEATFYQLEGADGDSFGTQSSVSANFYGAISPRGSRQGTIVFQVPTGAVKGLRLLYRPEVAKDTVLVALNL